VGSQNLKRKYRKISPAERIYVPRVRPYRTAYNRVISCRPRVMS
jgi:hypothetical protein